MELIGFSLHPDLSGRLDEIIDLLIAELTQGSATLSPMGDRGIGTQQIHFTLQMNLDDLPVLSRTRKMVGDALVKEDMQYDVIKGRVLRVPVPFPVRDVHIPLYVAFEGLFPIDANRRMNEIGTGLAVPESELDNLNQGADGRAESRAKCAGIPQSLPLPSTS